MTQTETIYGALALATTAAAGVAIIWGASWRETAHVWQEEVARIKRKRSRAASRGNLTRAEKRRQTPTPIEREISAAGDVANGSEGASIAA